MKHKVIIWAADDFNSLGLLRILGENDIDLFFLIKGKRGYAAKSQYCVNFKETSTYQQGYDFLMSNFRGEELKPIIITSGDGISVFIDQHKDDLEQYFIIPGTTEKGILEKYTDKNTMTKLAMDLGIVCPKSMYCQWDTNIDNVSYPCLIKPSHQKPGHYNEFKFKICKNKSELQNTLKMVRHDSEFILQDCIKKEKDLLVYGARLWNGETILAGCFIKDRLAECGSGSYGLLTKDIPMSVDTFKISAFLEKIDYHGLFSFEYGLVKDTAYFFEVNLRNDGTSHYFYQAGANIPLAYVCSCANMDYSSVSTIVTEDSWYIDELFDYENVVNGSISQKQYERDKAKATIYKYWSEKDPKPWQYMKNRRLKKMTQDMLLKRFRVYIIYVLDKLGLRK